MIQFHCVCDVGRHEWLVMGGKTGVMALWDMQLDRKQRTYQEGQEGWRDPVGVWLMRERKYRTLQMQEPECGQGIGHGALPKFHLAVGTVEWIVAAWGQPHEFCWSPVHYALSNIEKHFVLLRISWSIVYLIQQYTITWDKAFLWIPRAHWMSLLVFLGLCYHRSPLQMLFIATSLSLSYPWVKSMSAGLHLMFERLLAGLFALPGAEKLKSGYFSTWNLIGWQWNTHRKMKHTHREKKKSQDLKTPELMPSNLPKIHHQRPLLPEFSSWSLYFEWFPWILWTLINRIFRIMTKSMGWIPLTVCMFHSVGTVKPTCLCWICQDVKELAVWSAEPEPFPIWFIRENLCQPLV